MREIKHKLNKDELILTGFSVCHTISNLFLGTFVISFLMHNSINDIVSVSAYRLFYYFAICITFILSANWCKRGNKNTVFGMNIVTRIILLTIIAILGPTAADYVILLGILYGIFDGFYNLPMHAMIIDKVSAERMVFFLGTKTAIKNIFKIMVPITLGILVTTKSLQNVAWIIMVMAVLEILLLFLLSPSKPYEQKCAKMVEFCKCAKKVPILHKLFLAEILRGFATVLTTVATMYIIYVFHTDMNLGIWTTIFAICTIVASWLFGRFCSRRDYKWIMTLCSSIMIFAAIALFINVTRFSALIYAFSTTVCIEIMTQICAANVLDMARTKFITNKYCIEYLVIRDTVLFIGRWIAFVMLMYIGVFGLYDFLGIFIIVSVLAQILGCMILTNLTNKIAKAKC